MLTTFENIFITERNAGNTLTQSMRIALEKSGKDPNKFNQKYLYEKAKQLMEKPRVKQALINRQAIMEYSANLASQRLQQIIQFGKDADAISASRFVLEQVDGKARQVVDINNTSVKLQIDLSGQRSSDQ